VRRALELLLALLVGLGLGVDAGVAGVSGRMPDARFSAEDLAALWQASADIRHRAQAIIERSRQLREEGRELRQRAHGRVVASQCGWRWMRTRSSPPRGASAGVMPSPGTPS
jgi:hypothetical protein